MRLIKVRTSFWVQLCQNDSSQRKNQYIEYILHIPCIVHILYIVYIPYTLYTVYSTLPYRGNFSSFKSFISTAAELLFLIWCIKFQGMLNEDHAHFATTTSGFGRFQWYCIIGISCGCWADWIRQRTLRVWKRSLPLKIEIHCHCLSYESTTNRISKPFLHHVG